MNEPPPLLSSHQPSLPPSFNNQRPHDVTSCCKHGRWPKRKKKKRCISFGATVIAAIDSEMIHFVVLFSLLTTDLFLSQQFAVSCAAYGFHVVVGRLGLYREKNDTVTRYTKGFRILLYAELRREATITRHVNCRRTAPLL